MNPIVLLLGAVALLGATTLAHDQATMASLGVDALVLLTMAIATTVHSIHHR